jgi:hypothetical protein
MGLMVLAAILAGAGATPQRPISLSLTATPVRSVYRVGEAQLVRVTLENTADPSVVDFSDPVFVVVVPRLTFGRTLSGWPYLQVVFEVTDPDGLAVVPVEDEMLSKLVPPDPSWFSELHAGQFFGNVVDLRSLGFRSLKRGAFTVRARLSSDARMWLDAWLKKHRRDRDTLLFSYDHVFEGRLESETTSFAIE